MNNITDSDSINLYQIFDILISKFVSLVLLSFILSTILIYYVYQIPNRLTVTINIDQLDNIDLVKFENIKRLIKDNIGETDDFESDTLEELFINKFLSYSHLSKNFYDNFKIDSITDDDNLESLSLSKAKQFNINRASPKDRVERYSRSKLIFEVNSNDLNNHLKILDKSITAINKEIYRELLNVIKYYSAIVDSKNQMMIKQIERKLQMAKRKFLLEHEKNLTYLEEQFWIAKELNISQGSTSGDYVEFNYLPPPQKSDTELGIKMKSDNQLDYLRGYPALENQIKKVKERDLERIELYDNGYTELLLKLDELKMMSVQSDIEEAMMQFPTNEQFKAININLNLIKKEAVTKKQFMYVIMIFSSIITSIIIILIMYGYRKYKET